MNSNGRFTYPLALVTNFAGLVFAKVKLVGCLRFLINQVMLGGCCGFWALIFVLLATEKLFGGLCWLIVDIEQLCDIFFVKKRQRIVRFRFSVFWDWKAFSPFLIWFLIWASTWPSSISRLISYCLNAIFLKVVQQRWYFLWVLPWLSGLGWRNSFAC